MKCDELKAYRNIDVAFNTARQTETVIAEDYEGYCIEFEEDDEVYLKDEVDAAIAELKQKLHDAEMQADLAECAVTEYKIDYDKLNDENRKLKRALYKACANWAHHRVFVRFKTNEKAWQNVERKCLDKAEEYK